MRKIISSCLLTLLSVYSRVLIAVEDIKYHEMALDGWPVFIEQKLVDNND